MLDLETYIPRHSLVALVEFKSSVNKFMGKHMQCSDFSLERSEDISGTAPNWNRVLIVSLAIPWASKIENSRYFPENVRLLMNNEVNMEGLRIQCILPDEAYVQAGITKVLDYQKSVNNGYINGYSKAEFDIPTSELNQMIPEIINGKFNRKSLSPSNQTRDLFICTHGSRDACCGTYGFVLYEKLKKIFQNNSNVRIWRISHFGGHRFAPNLLDMPQGRMWARFNEDEALSIIQSKIDFEIVNKCYRGLISLDSSFEQVLEQQLFSHYGSEWIDRNVKSILVPESDMESGLVNVEVEDSNHIKNFFSAKVSVNGYIPMLKCMSDNFSDEFSPQYSVDWVI